MIVSTHDQTGPAPTDEPLFHTNMNSAILFALLTIVAVASAQIYARTHTHIFVKMVFVVQGRVKGSQCTASMLSHDLSMQSHENTLVQTISWLVQTISWLIQLVQTIS